MRTKLVIAAVATAATVSAVGASAYTNSLTGANTRYVGYASTTISGAHFNSQPTFTYNGDGTTITRVTVVLDGDTHASQLFVRHDEGATVGTAETCSAGALDDPVHPTTTTYVCTLGTAWSVANTTTIAYSLQ